MRKRQFKKNEYGSLTLKKIRREAYATVFALYGDMAPAIALGLESEISAKVAPYMDGTK